MCLLCATLAWQDHARGFGGGAACGGARTGGVGVDGEAGAVGGRGVVLPGVGGGGGGGGVAPPPTVIYASRTHSQLAHVMGEVRHAGCTLVLLLVVLLVLLLLSLPLLQC